MTKGSAMEVKVWRERFGLASASDDEYYCSTYCTNGCGYRGERQILVKKGVRRDSITDIRCSNCGCECKL